MRALLLTLLVAFGIEAQAQGVSAPSQSEYMPPGGRGRIVMMLSGQTGPRQYKPIAEQVARLGYYTVLLDGNDVLTQDQKGGDRLQAAINRALASPHAVAGKVAVIGYSMGGGAALWHSAASPDSTAGVIAYYPATTWITQYSSYTGITDVKDYARRIKVPVLLLAGEADTYHDCCLIETARTIAASARRIGAPLELVTYPGAQHGFNLRGLGHQDAADKDAWQRMVERLARTLSN
ncbi:MAG TPA: dienelactone hydrolase family protein [Reyranella sp.]|nr:dienelactone hydrolase family protein [Reyranella sp.]